MTTDRPWADLPNARHIDTVLADVKARPEVWRQAGNVCFDAVNLAESIDAARRTARTSFRRYDVDSARDLLHKAFSSNWAWIPASDAMDALIAWDDSADLLDLPADTLRTMIDLAPPPVCHQAVLLLPWAIVRSNT